MINPKNIAISKTFYQQEQPQTNNIPNQTIININKNIQINNNKFNPISAKDLLDTTYPALLPVVDSLLYPGCTIMAGAPKTGKSFLMLQLAQAVSTGDDFLSFKTNKSDVLYLALEDIEERLQRRYSKMIDLENDNLGLFFSTGINSLNQGLFADLDNFLNEHPKTKLIIIDTLAKVIELQETQFSYNSDYDLIGKIKEYADNKKLCIVVIHHLRKQADNDIFNTISGSTGITGAVDSSFVLKKNNRSENKSILYATGRDIPDLEFELEQNKINFKWKISKIKSQNTANEIDDVILKISTLINKENPIWVGTSSNLITILNLDIVPNVLTRKLNSNTSILLSKFNIFYNTYRNHQGRFIELKYNSNINI